MAISDLRDSCVLAATALALAGCVSDKQEFSAAMLVPAAPEVKLPDTMTVTASPTETEGYEIAYLEIPSAPALSPQGMLRTATSLAESALSPLTNLASGGTQKVDGLIEKYASINEVPSELVRKVVKRESNFNPSAYNHGHWGLMQIKHATAKGMGYDGDAKGLLDAETNLKYAVKYLRGAYMVAGGDYRRADRLYQTGYYYDAKRAGLLDETGLGRDRVRHRGLQVAETASFAVGNEPDLEERWAPSPGGGVAPSRPSPNAAGHMPTSQSPDARQSAGAAPGI